ncbi:MAG: hypothetical protein ABIH23_10405 [bacterium]
MLKICLTVFCCFLSIHAYADEFERYREALRTIRESFTHYSATIHILHHEKTSGAPAMRLISEATCAFEIQQIIDRKIGVRFWCHDVTEIVNFSTGTTVSDRTVITSACVPVLGAYRLEELWASQSGKQIMGTVDDSLGFKYRTEYPDAVCGFHYLDFGLPESAPLRFSYPKEDHEGLPGMRVDFQNKHISVWFSPSHDYFPVFCEQLAGKESDRLITCRICEIGAARHNDAVIYYPQQYEQEMIMLSSDYRILYSVRVLSIQFHKFNPAFFPTITFPAGIAVQDRGSGDSYITHVSETHPKAKRYAVIFICGWVFVAILAIVGSVYYRRKTRRATVEILRE